MNVLDLGMWGAGLLLAAWVLQRNLWRAVLVVWPSSLRIEADAPAGHERLPSELRGLDQALKAMGFSSLGQHVERPYFTRELVSLDYAHAGERAYASLYLGRDGQARLYFLSRTDQGAFVLSANHRRPSTDLPGRYFSGSLEDVAADRIFNAHKKRTAAYGAPVGEPTQEARVELARAWYRGPGGPEVRQQNVLGLLWTVGTLGMVAAAILGKGAHR